MIFRRFARRALRYNNRSRPRKLGQCWEANRAPTWDQDGGGLSFVTRHFHSSLGFRFGIKTLNPGGLGADQTSWEKTGQSKPLLRPEVLLSADAVIALYVGLLCVWSEVPVLRNTVDSIVR